MELADSTYWFNGPEWLLTSNKDDTTQVTRISMPTECASELKAKERQELAHSLLNTEEGSISNLIKVEDHSDLKHLLHVTARVIMFTERLKGSQTHINLNQAIARAEILWVREAQLALVSNRNIDVWKKQFGFFLDENAVWRCKGRLQNAEIPYSAKHPIMLPKDHGYTKLIVKQAHERVFHNGPKETLTELRAKYWVIQGRSLASVTVLFVADMRHHLIVLHCLRRYLPFVLEKNRLSPVPALTLRDPSTLR